MISDIDGIRMEKPKKPPGEEKDMGICEECGEYTDTLVYYGTSGFCSDAVWICKKCAKYV